VNPAGAITDVRHIVILMVENRSLEHYFGHCRNVRGFVILTVAKPSCSSKHSIDP
jgi:phospholipase C